MILRLVKMTFQTEKVDDFLKIFNEVKSKIIAFEGCVGLKLYEDMNQRNVLFTQSEWMDEAALDAYRNSEFFKLTWNKTKVLFSDKAEAWSLSIKN